MRSVFHIFYSVNKITLSKFQKLETQLEIVEVFLKGTKVCVDVEFCVKNKLILCVLPIRSIVFWLSTQWVVISKTNDEFVKPWLVAAYMPLCNLFLLVQNNPGACKLCEKSVHSLCVEEYVCSSFPHAGILKICGVCVACQAAPAMFKLMISQTQEAERGKFELHIKSQLNTSTLTNLYITRCQT